MPRGQRITSTSIRASRNVVASGYVAADDLHEIRIVVVIAFDVATASTTGRRL